MRLRRGASEELEGEEANGEVVLQLGQDKIPLKAERLLGTAVRVSASAGSPQQHMAEPVQDDQDRALQALEQMQHSLTSVANRNASQAFPWSPDDYGKFAQTPQTGHHGNIPLREPWDSNLPAYYDAQQLPPHLRCQTSASAMRDGALHKGIPTIFDNLGESRSAGMSSPQAAKQQQEMSRRFKTTGHSGRPKGLDLVHMFPQSRSSSGQTVSSSQLTHSPSAVGDGTDRILTPHSQETRSKRSRLKSASLRISSGPAKKKVVDSEILDQHKTNVRRPPKGIQNWFDAYLDLDDDDEEDDDEEEDEEEEQSRPPPNIDSLPPQELPADDILPPAYSPPSRELSRASEKSSASRSRSLGPICDDHLAAERNAVRNEMRDYRANSDSHSWDSIQSSHLERVAPNGSEEQIVTNPTGAQSDLSFSGSDYDDEYDDDRGVHATRENISGARHLNSASTSSVDVHRLLKPQRIQERRSFGNESRQSKGSKPSSRSSNPGTPGHQRRDKALTIVLEDDSPEQLLLRRLNGLTVETGSSDAGLMFDDAGNISPHDASHVMSVTEEEKMLLDLMRRKRAAMQQMSFTEGYQIGPRGEQQRLAKRPSSVEQTARRALRQKEFMRRDSQLSSATSPTTPLREYDLQRQLSAMRKEQVDETFQIERYLGMSQSSQSINSHLPESIMATESLNGRISDEFVPATIYNPSDPSFGMTQEPESILAVEDADTIRQRVEHFIATNGAVPPLNTSIKLMQRRPTRSSRAASVPPPAVIPQEAPPEIPNRSPQRHRRNTSGASTMSSLNHKFSSVSMDAEPRDKSPISREKSSIRDHQLRGKSLPDLHPSDPPDYEDLETLPVISPTAYAPTSNPASPFSSIISAATKTSPNVSPKTQSNARCVNVNRQQQDQGEYVLDMEPSSQSTEQLPTGVKRIPLSRFSTLGAAPRGSPASSTSASEEVLGAWAELGGGRQQGVVSSSKRRDKSAANGRSSGHVVRA